MSSLSEVKFRVGKKDGYKGLKPQSNDPKYIEGYTHGVKCADERLKQLMKLTCNNN